MCFKRPRQCRRWSRPRGRLCFKRPLGLADGHGHEDTCASHAHVGLADGHGFEDACASESSTTEVAEVFDDSAVNAYSTSAVDVEFPDDWGWPPDVQCDDCYRVKSVFLWCPKCIWDSPSLVGSHVCPKRERCLLYGAQIDEIHLTDT